jgi:hypothetical protein
MSRIRVGLLLVGLASVAGACRKESSEEPRKVRLELKRAETPPPASVPRAAEEEEPPEERPLERRVSSDDDKVGVAECDEYITKFMACMEQQPETNRETMRAGFESTRQAWRAAAGTEQMRKELAAACRTALAAARRSPATKKCKW